ncbi:hypothetical protein EKH55_1287 [Sinorhizobium alkalisoli]|nr:hypothetical protein EKH55_1287 [Sinorhizobium alkalisoli]
MNPGFGFATTVHHHSTRAFQRETGNTLPIGNIDFFAPMLI